MEIQPELLKEYLLDADEQIQTIENTVVHLEKKLSSEDINELFRAFHTIKGNSALIGILEIRDISHAAESMIGDVRTGIIPMSREIADLILQSVDMVKKMLKKVSAGEQIFPGHDVLIEIIQNFRVKAKTAATESKPAPHEAKPEEKTAAPSGKPESPDARGKPQKLVVKTHKDIAIVEIPGTFDERLAADFSSFLNGLKDRGFSRYVFDFSSTSAVTERGIGHLINTRKSLEGSGNRIASCGMSPAIYRDYSSRHSDSALNVKSSIRDALKSL